MATKSNRRIDVDSDSAAAAAVTDDDAIKITKMATIT